MDKDPTTEAVLLGASTEHWTPRLPLNRRDIGLGYLTSTLLGMWNWFRVAPRQKSAERWS